jgi:glutathione S-transferase
VLVPRLSHDGATVWDTLAIGEYLNEVRPAAGLLPADRVARAQCRSICGEMHSGFGNLRSGLPMNLKAHHPDFKIWSGAKADIDRITTIWRECLATWKGPYSSASSAWPTRCTRRWSRASSPTTSPCDDECAAYGRRIIALPDMVEWVAAARAEPDEIEELDVEF